MGNARDRNFKINAKNFKTEESIKGKCIKINMPGSKKLHE